MNINIDNLVDELVESAINNLICDYKTKFHQIIYKHLYEMGNNNLPFESKEFYIAWNTLLNEKKWKKKSKNAINTALKKLSEYSELDAIQMIEFAIAGEYQGIHPLKNNKNYANRKQHQNNLTKQLTTSEGFGAFRD